MAGMPDSLWIRLAELPVLVQSYELERLPGTASNGFEPITTLVGLSAGGADGLGENGFRREAQRSRPSR